jgi:hypothetical protein
MTPGIHDPAAEFTLIIREHSKDEFKELTQTGDGAQKKVRKAIRRLRHTSRSKGLKAYLG